MIARCAALTVPLSALMLPVDCLELRIDGIGSPTQRAREEREKTERKIETVSAVLKAMLVF